MPLLMQPSIPLAFCVCCPPALPGPPSTSTHHCTERVCRAQTRTGLVGDPREPCETKLQANLAAERDLPATETFPNLPLKDTGNTALPLLPRHSRSPPRCPGTTAWSCQAQHLPHRLNERRKSHQSTAQNNSYTQPAPLNLVRGDRLYFSGLAKGDRGSGTRTTRPPNKPLERSISWPKRHHSVRQLSRHTSLKKSGLITLLLLQKPSILKIHRAADTNEPTVSLGMHEALERIFFRRA